MPRSPRFVIAFAPEALEHIGVIERRFHRLIRETIDEQLGYTPQRVTRNRKRLDLPAPFGATWELRFGPGNRFRVFYEVEPARGIVWILAIGVKEGNRLYVAGEEYQA